MAGKGGVSRIFAEAYGWRWGHHGHPVATNFQKRKFGKMGFMRLQAYAFGVGPKRQVALEDGIILFRVSLLVRNTDINLILSI